MPSPTSHTSLVPEQASKAVNHFFFQPKLTINEPDDIYEREADAVADKIMRLTDNNIAQTNFFKPSVSVTQRKCADCEEEEKRLTRKEISHADKQIKTDPFFIQRQEADESTPEPANGENATSSSSLRDFVLPTTSLLQPPGTPDFLSMRQPFLNRGVPGSWNPDAALRVWNYNFNFFRGIGISPGLSTTLTNFTAPRSIDAQLRLSNPTWWEVTDRELNTSTIGGSIPLLEFNADFSPTAPSWLRSILGGGERGVRRKCADCGNEEKLQLKEKNNEGKTADEELESYINNLGNNGQPMVNEVRNFYEPRFGYDFSNVRIHADQVAARSAQSINALAYTSGNNIVFNSGQFSPSTDTGKRLLGHELTHVVQQNNSSALNASGPVQREIDRRDPIHDPLLDRFSEETGEPREGVSQHSPAYEAWLLQSQSAPSASSPRVRGADPTVCLTPLCDRLASPSATCRRDPHACAQTWKQDVLACIRANAFASNASHANDIIVNTAVELDAQLAYMDSIQPVRTASDKRHYIDWLKDYCETKQRELRIEFYHNIVFQEVPVTAGNQTFWANRASDWNSIEEALAAIPDEHLFGRASNLPVVSFRREHTHPSSSPGQFVGGETDPGTGLVRIFDAGLGATPYTRSASLGLSATNQTIRHEVGHLVDSMLTKTVMDDFFNNAVNWKEYSWGWVSPHPSPYPTWAAERERLCRDIGFLNRQNSCDQDRLTEFLRRVEAAGTITENGRVFSKTTSFLEVWPVGNVPTGTEFEYARTSKGDYFAEIYAFALSVPEFLHRSLPQPQIDWLKRNVFNTGSHYNVLIAPYEHLALNASTSTMVSILQLLNSARQKFTRQQLLPISQQLQIILQQVNASAAGGTLG